MNTNPDTLSWSEPALDLHSRATSSVGVTSPFQQSQHRKKFRKRADKKCLIKNPRNLFFTFNSAFPIVQVSSCSASPFSNVYLHFLTDSNKTSQNQTAGRLLVVLHDMENFAFGERGRQNSVMGGREKKLSSTFTKELLLWSGLV